MPFHFYRLLVSCILTGLTLNGVASQVARTLYLNRGVFTTVHKTTFPYIAFNSSKAFQANNTIIQVRVQDTLILKVINNDTVVHGFAVQDYPGTNVNISPADSILDTLTFTGQRIYIYYDPYQYPRNRYLGAAGMICVNNSATSKKYFWNIKEHQTDYNKKLAANGSVNWSAYEPDYFTINGKSFPELDDDTTAAVYVNLGDTVHIAMINTGQSAHSIHFHGFHCKVLYATAIAQTGAVKDTFPLKRMEAMLLEMVPDKKGRYPVHDHNLIAVSGGGLHPNGMFLIMGVQ